ncbi:hypothetical protein FB465_1886 [Kitasatospora atroaurantiaca]|uniref:Uncharacterized protein n=1 Tax=Kitasatospora atroaurantiaca TaxID=285545 RepID=A0A561EMU2_9ACTN|nr:hypothetical protein FB465_1886 [Kitasatospora atroaurantiaca]
MRDDLTVAKQAQGRPLAPYLDMPRRANLVMRSRGGSPTKTTKDLTGRLFIAIIRDMFNMSRMARLANWQPFFGLL